MNFTIKASVAAVAVATFGLAAQANDVTVTPYGKINVSYQSTDDVDAKGTEIKSNASRFGLKGKAKLSDSLNAIYQLEWEVDVSDKSKTSQDHIKSRNQFVGLGGDFGEVIAGRFDTPVKKAQGKVDLFNDLEADIKHLIAGENRADSIVQYSTPKFAGGLTFKIASAEMDSDELTADDQKKLTTGTSYSVEYSTKNFFIAYAQDEDIKKLNTKTSRIAMSYKMGDWTLGALYNEYDNGSFDEEGYIVSAAYKAGDHTLKLQHGESDNLADFTTGEAVDKTMTSIGWDIKLAKNTKTYFFYTKADDKANNDESWFGLGLEQKF